MTLVDVIGLIVLIMVLRLAELPNMLIALIITLIIFELPSSRVGIEKTPPRSYVLAEIVCWLQTYFFLLIIALVIWGFHAAPIVTMIVIIAAYFGLIAVVGRAG